MSFSDFLGIAFVFAVVVIISLIVYGKDGNGSTIKTSSSTTNQRTPSSQKSNVSSQNTTTQQNNRPVSPSEGPSNVNRQQGSKQANHTVNPSKQNDIGRNNIITQNAFVMYVLSSVLDVGFFTHTGFETDEDILWAKYQIIKSYKELKGDCDKYEQKGKFSLYNYEQLSPKYKILMDLYEMLIFGKNDSGRNRSVEIPHKEAFELKVSLWPVMGLLTHTDEHTMRKKMELAHRYGQIFEE